jgi:pimeloyl-ACP methyl ester carboxylesterase
MEDGEQLQAILTSADSAVEQQLNAIMNMSDDEAKNIPADGGITIYYYKEMEERPTSEYVKNITIPFLILQGSNDFQVYADKDYVEWQKLLEGRQNITFKLYDGLNHLFMPSAGATIVNYQEEYNIASHVNEQVLTDVAEWIKAN